MDISIERKAEDPRYKSPFCIVPTSPSAFYEVPNHFPTWSKGGLSQCLPRRFKQVIPKTFQVPNFCIGAFSSNVSANALESPCQKKASLPRNSVNSPSVGQTRTLPKEKDYTKTKSKMLSLCEELELSVRKIPSFQVKGVPTPTHTKYDIIKTINPLKILGNFPKKTHVRILTGEVRKPKKFQIDIPEIIEQDKRKNKMWIFMYFLDIIRASNGLSLQIEETRNYKFYVGPGNNSNLIVRLMRSSPGWSKTDSRKEANFVWTSLKHKKTLKKLTHGKNMILNKGINIKLPRNRIADAEKFGYQSLVNSKYYCKLETIPISSNSIKICNKLEKNQHICSKKLMFYNLRNFYTKKGKNIFDVVPVTFHVKSTGKDKNFLEFMEYYKEQEKKKMNNIWIIKPGENTNRVASSLEEIIELFQDKISIHTCIIQKYIERPLLVNKRKFDIRCFALMTSVNSNIQGYFYTEGYIRTSSKKFSTKHLENKYIHLTNDAVQKKSEDYGKYEAGNKISYNDLQNYKNTTYPKANINFENDIQKKIKNIVRQSFKAVYDKIDQYKRLHSFELFGYDFMIDEDFNVWLIEANTNPCLKTECAFLSRIIPAGLENTLCLFLDQLFPPPQESKKTMWWLEDINIENKFELVFNAIDSYKNFIG
ncbi:hypothetical protein SteCoe_12889 [Stentor coeruleus]|uniref:Tubulin-tyrosine ligase n=1 Tax=Stentor coeruleus TaxID=5963 RepID=A0A1R2C9Q5_9CILI|nr:hypothetical protein SteCoe_12889 [Stentor coeruleus]